MVDLSASRVAYLLKRTSNARPYEGKTDERCSPLRSVRSRFGRHRLKKRLRRFFCTNLSASRVAYLLKRTSNARPYEGKTDERCSPLRSVRSRFVFVTSSEMDEWADPDSEFLSCCAASPAYSQVGRVGFCHKNKMPEIDERYMDGRIGYRRRAGMHFLSRHDWAVFLDFIRHHEKDAL